jgi:tetratricopeptide (TPR) repeat protein
MTREFEAALRDQEHATELFTRLVLAEPSPQLIQRLASSLNNRALSLSELQRDDEALRDYDRAVALLEQQTAVPTYPLTLGLCLVNRGNLQKKLGHLSKASVDYLRSVELLSLETNPTLPRHWDAELATSLKEYGLLQLVAGDIGAGVDALERAVRLCEPRLRTVQWHVYQSDLAEAKEALARHYAAPGSRHTDAAKAVRYATHACDLTGWSEPRFIETLGAAVAAAGDAESAARWERRAAAKRRAP